MSTGMLRSGYLLSIVECQIKETSEHARSRGTARLLRSLRGEFSRGRWFEEQNEVPPCLVTKDERRNKEERWEFGWMRTLLASCEFVLIYQGHPWHAPRWTLGSKLDPLEIGHRDGKTTSTKVIFFFEELNPLAFGNLRTTWWSSDGWVRLQLSCKKRRSTYGLKNETLEPVS